MNNPPISLAEHNANWDKFCEAPSFLKPNLLADKYYQIETTQGTEIIPAHITNARGPARNFTAMCQGDILMPLDELMLPQQGYVARMFAPGYLDCTEWTAFPTLRQAQEYLMENYADDNNEDNNNE